jgi:tRNA:m4X modification enzyme
MNYRNKGGKVEGIAIALCCHQLCRFESYINPSYLESKSITKETFEAMAIISTWAVCGPAVETDPVQMETQTTKNSVSVEVSGLMESDQTGTVQATTSTPKIHWTGLAFDERVSLGLMCKHIFNVGRLQAINEAGAKCKLVYYVDKAKSLENVCLLGYWDN